MNYNNIDTLINGFDRVLRLDSVGAPTPVPAPLIYVGTPRRQGLSPTKIASRIIARKNEAGIPVGALPSGEVNPEEIMWKIAVEEIIKAFQEEAVLRVALPPGITLTASGISPTGPVTVFGTTMTFGSGFGIIQ